MKFILGLFFVFVKTNFDFIDTGAFYYLSNLLGYVLIFSGLRDLKREGLDKTNSALYLALIMIVHSLLFSTLNLAGYTLKTIALTTNLNCFVSFLSLVLIIFGMLAVFFIINSFIKVKNINLEKELGILLIVFIATGGLSYLFPNISAFLISFLVIMEFLFLYQLAKRAKEVNLVLKL